MPWAQHSVLPSAHTQSTDPQWLLACISSQCRSGITFFVHNLMVSMRTVRINQMIKIPEIIIHEKSGKGGRKGKRNRERKKLFMQKVTQGHETIGFAVFLVWGFLFVWLVCFFRRQPILSFCSSVLCLFHCPTARYCCYTNKLEMCN